MRRKVIKVILLLLFISGGLYLSNEMEKDRCSGFEQFKARIISGKVVGKCEETANHGYEYIRMNPDIGKLYLVPDVNSVYDYLKVGDYIEKRINSDTLWITRRNQIVFKIVDLGCE